MRYIAVNGHQRYEIELDAFTKDVGLSSDMKRRFEGLSTIFKHVDETVWYKILFDLDYGYWKLIEAGQSDEILQKLLNDKPTLESTKRWYCLPNTPEEVAERMYRDDLERWQKKLDANSLYKRVVHIDALWKLWKKSGSKKLKQIKVFSDRKKYSMDKVPNLR